jgi:peptidoglycan/xylan/chitin deacetylase (PgdA/CDA1 family)
MKPYFIKTPNLVKFLFRNWVWSFSKKEKVLYLTFDDGPTPEITVWTLKQLKKFQAKATFFCIGKNIAQHQKIYQKIIEQGHSIGNHTNNHLNGFKTAANAYIHNIEKAELLLQNNTKIFRPPYGKIYPSQAKKLRKKGYKIIMWDVLSADFDTKISKEKCLENVLKHSKNGSIIVFHDSIKARDNLYFTLPKVLEYFTAKGFVFKSIG